MTRTGNEAIAYARAQNSNGSTAWEGLCLKFVRTCFDVAPYYPDASSAWRGADHRHVVHSGADCPRAVPVFWTGGSRGFGHVALSVGGGLCWSSDAVVPGGVHLVEIDELTRRWGLAWQGWSEDINEVRVWTRTDREPVGSKWTEGDVYVSKLHEGQRDSDSVRRLQHRLLHHPHIPARAVRINGNYDDGTRSAVSHWQRKIAPDHLGGPNNGTLVTNRQANRFFGENFNVIENEDEKEL